MNEEAYTAAKLGMDLASWATLGGWLVGALPAIATLLTIAWTVIRIYETRTFQRWLGKKE